MLVKQSDITIEQASERREKLLEKLSAQRDKKPPSVQTRFRSIVRRIRNFASASIDHAISGFQKADSDEIRRRLTICESCEYLTEKQICGTTETIISGVTCGCRVKTKSKWKEQQCPQNKWEIKKDNVTDTMK